MKPVAGIAKRLLSAALVVGASLVVALALAEGLLRVFPQALPVEVRIALENSPETRGIADPYLGHRPVPGGVSTIWTRDFKHDYVADSRGFRNAEPWPQTVDIAVIGDSLVFGYGVDDREHAWPQMLEQLLPGREVLNLGLVGAGPQQYARIFERIAAPVRPKLVIVGFYAHNDFWDADLFEQWTIQGGQGNYMVWRDFERTVAPVSEVSLITRLRNLLRMHSHLYAFSSVVGSMVRSRASGEPILLPWSDGSRLVLMPRTADTLTLHAVAGDAVFAKAMSAVADLRDSVAATDAELLIVLQPSKEEIYMSFAGQPAPDYSADLRPALDELGIQHLDLAPAFRERAAKGERLFFPTDGHPTDAGYRLTAETVAAFLQHSGWVDRWEPGA